MFPTQATVSSSSTLAPRTSLNIRTNDGRDASRADSLSTSKSGIDTVIVFAAQDSMRYFVRDKHLRLRGNASVKNRQQTLSAEVIDVYFGKGYMQAQTARDSLGRVYGVPKFSDGKESYYGASLTYNFRTQRGTIALAETKMNDGFVFGERIKKVSDNTFYLKEGCYTTCREAHPHFYIKSPRMKLITQDKVFADPLIFYIEDIPLLAVPFGVFLELGGKSGRRSGVLIPQVNIASPIGSVSGRGIMFDNIGYYFAINDNLEAKVTAQVFTKGGIVGRLQGTYNFGQRLTGNIDFNYGSIRNAPTEGFTDTWRFSLNHRQDFTPFTSIRGNLDFSSPGFNRQTQFDIRTRVQQTVNSNFTLNHRFDNNSPLSLTYSRIQNLATQEISQTLIAQTGFPQWYPFKSLVPRDSWISDVFFNYSVSANAGFETIPDSIPNENSVERLRRLSTKQPFTARVVHSPSINISPRLGYFTVQPNVSYSETWFFQRIFERRSLAVTNANVTKDSVQNGFFRDYTADFSVNVSTRLYGILNPRILGLNSLRHTLSPSIGVNYQPNFSAPELGMVAQVLDSTGKIYRDKNGDTINYSRFARDGGSVRNPGITAGLRWSLDNNFEAKIAESDTSEKTIQLMSVNLSGSVNFAASTFKWSPIGMSFSNNLGGLQFSGSAGFDMYKRVADTLNGVQVFRRVDTLLLSKGEGLARLTNIGFTLGFSAGSNGTSFGNAAGNVPGSTTLNNPNADTTARTGGPSKEDLALGARFQQRMDNTYQQLDWFGENSPGYRPLDFTWNSNYNAAFNYAPPAAPNLPATITAFLSAGFSATFERTWNLSTNFSFDAVSRQFNAPTITLSKDLSDCWAMSLTWNPIGQSQAFMFRIGMKVAQLKDIQYMRQQNPLFRQ